MYQESGQNLFLCHGTPNFNCTLNKISNWSLFKLIISDQALITLELFLLRYVRFNGQKFSGLLEKLSLNPRCFFVKNAKICFFEKSCLSEVLYQIYFHLVTNGFSRLQSNNKDLKL